MDRLTARIGPQTQGKQIGQTEGSLDAQMGHQDGGAASVASRAVGVLFGPPDLCRDLGRERRNRREFRGPRQHRDLNMTRAAIAATGPPDTPKMPINPRPETLPFASRVRA